MAAASGESSYLRNPEDAEKADSIARWMGQSREIHGYGKPEEAKGLPNWQHYLECLASFEKNEDFYLGELVEAAFFDFFVVLTSSRGDGAFRLYRASRYDDVLSATDYILSFPESGKFLGIDLAISSNETYLKEKALQEHVRCEHFLAYQKSFAKQKYVPQDIWRMPREVWAVDPSLAVRYLEAYLARIAEAGSITLRSFQRTTFLMAREAYAQAMAEPQSGELRASVGEKVRASLQPKTA